MKEIPGWLEDLMDLLGLDDLERHNWIRRWTDFTAPHPRTHLTFLSPRQMQDLQGPLRRNPDEIDELVIRGLIRQRDVLQLKAMDMGVGYVDLDRVSGDDGALRSVSRQLVTETSAIPVKRDGNILWVALSNPKEIATLDRYRIETGCRIIPVLATAHAIYEMIRQHYPEGG